MFGIQRKRRRRELSPIPVVYYMRERAAPLSALHVSLYRPSNYQTKADGAPLRRVASVPSTTAERQQQLTVRHKVRRLFNKATSYFLTRKAFY